MRKRNHTVTIRMNNEEYNLLQNKVKESGRTQQEVVIKAIADLKIASTEEVEELKRLNQMFADILSQLRGATTNINQIARKLHTDGEVPNDSKGEAYEFLMAYEESEKSADLRAVLGSIYRCKHSSDKELKRDIRCVGELTEEEVGKFLVLYKKSIDDLVQLFSGDQRMKEYLGV